MALGKIEHSGVYYLSSIEIGNPEEQPERVWIKRAWFPTYKYRLTFGVSVPGHLDIDKIIEQEKKSQIKLPSYLVSIPLEPKHIVDFGLKIRNDEEPCLIFPSDDHRYVIKMVAKKHRNTNFGIIQLQVTDQTYAQSFFDVIWNLAGKATKYKLQKFFIESISSPSIYLVSNTIDLDYVEV
jgi:hypothetical protein